MNYHEVLADRYGTEEALTVARRLLESEDQSEEAFLGAQGIMLLHGLI